MIKDIKTVKITDKGQIAIPKSIRLLDDFKEGEKIAVIVYDDHVELRPLKSVARRITK